MKVMRTTVATVVAAFQAGFFYGFVSEITKLKRWFKKFVMNISFLLIVWRMQRRLCFVM